MQFLKRLYRLIQKQTGSISNDIGGEYEAKKWNGPKYIIGFPNCEKPFLPYYHIADQNSEWIEAPTNGHFYYDPIEDCDEFKEINQIVDQLVDKELGDRKKLFGACHSAWSIKKRILKEKFDIEWHSIADLNPLCHFD